MLTSNLKDLQKSMSATDQDGTTNTARKLGFIGDGKAAGALGELAAVTDLTFVDLADKQAGRSVHLGTDGVLDCAGPGAVIVEMSTVAPETSQQLYQAGRERRRCPGRRSLRTNSGWRGRRVDFVRRGRARVSEAFIPIFRSIAKQSFYKGSTGSGAAMKLIVNTVPGACMQAIVEAVSLGLWIKRNLLFDALVKTAVLAPDHAGKLAAAKRNDYTPGSQSV